VTVAEAASAGIVVIAVRWERVPEAVQGLDWTNQIVIDATNDWAADDLQGRTSSEPGGAMKQIHHPLAGLNLIRHERRLAMTVHAATIFATLAASRMPCDGAPP
jgi:predicted dinucleotide-binding enzyme